MRGRCEDPRTIAVLYEHPEWFKPLFAELERRGVPYERWEAHRAAYDPAVRRLPYALVINRMSPSAYLRGHASAIFYTRQLLAYLRDIGTPVINPYEAFAVETSKALQLEIFEKLRLRYPRTRLINHAELAPDAAQGFEFPVIVKPNIGGSGAKIQKFATRDELSAAAGAGRIDLGLDATALVQEFLPARDDSIVRVEVLDGRFLYAIKIVTRPDDDFNLCPADICQEESAAKSGAADDFSRCLAAAPAEKRRLHIESYAPPAQIVDDALAIAREARFDVGGIEYLVSERDGEDYFYDANALSNFVTDAPALVGFDPHARFARWLVARAGARELVAAG
jgi:hypothetical protein